MMRIRSMALLFAVIILSNCLAHASTIVLKNGSTIEATIAERSNDSIQVDIEGVPVTYYLSDIQSIDGIAVMTSETAVSANLNPNASVLDTAAPQSLDVETPLSQEKSIDKGFSTPSSEPLSQAIEEMSSQAQVNASKDTPETDATFPTYDSPDAQGTEIIPAEIASSPTLSRTPDSRTTSHFTKTPDDRDAPDNTDDSKVLSDTQNPDALVGKLNKDSDRTGRADAAAAGIAAGFFGILILAIVITYIFGALCLQIIAKKTSTENGWLAWIPIANLFLMCKIAGLPYWWCCSLLVLLVPVIGSFIFLAVTTYLWYKISMARGKPGWLGILTIIPLAGFVVMGYLAFSE